jgi:hypothetical protein
LRDSPNNQEDDSPNPFLLCSVYFWLWRKKKKDPEGSGSLFRVVFKEMA